MKQKTLLVLGASLYQVKAIRTAQTLGYRVVVADNVPENPGHRVANRSHMVSTIDRDAVLEVAAREGVHGVLAPATDVAVPCAAYVSKMLGLPGPPLESAEITSDKVRFRQFLTDHCFPVPEFLAVGEGAEPAASWFEGEPVIVKPTRSSGSKGVFVVRSRDEYLSCLPETIGFSPSGEAILERFIEGRQGTIEGALDAGEVKIRYFTDRQTQGIPYVTTTGHSVPSRLPGSLLRRVEEQVREAWRLLGIRSGPFDCDFVATEDEAYLLEMAPRLGGNSLAKLLEHCAGFDITAYAVRTACGDPTKPVARAFPDAVAVLILGVSEEGSLSYDVDQAEALRRESWVLTLEFDVTEGDAVMPFINGRNRVGEALLQAANRDELDNRVREFKCRLTLGVL